MSNIIVVLELFNLTLYGFNCVLLLVSAPEAQLLQQVTRGPNGLPADSSLHCATDSTAVQLSEMMPLPVLMKHSVTTPLITQ